MYLYTLELPKREGPKGHPNFVDGRRTYMVQVLSHTHAPPPPSDRSGLIASACVWAWAWAY